MVVTVVEMEAEAAEMEAATGRRRRGSATTLHENDHRGLADQVEAIRALLQSLRELVRSNVFCDRLSQTVKEESV